MAKLLAFISTALVLFLVIGMAVYFRYYAPVGSFIHRDLDPASVVHEVQQLSELVTVRYVMQKVIGTTEQHQPLGQESILLLVQGKVLAGVNLAQMNQYDVESIRGHQASLRLPPPRVIETFIDEAHTQVWDRKITWWTPWVTPDPNLEHQARLLALDSIRSAAIENGILNEARRNAQDTIRKFLAALGVTTVSFRELKSVS